jgi:hypothetical protein
MNKIRQKIELILNEIQSVLVNNEIEDCEEFIAKIVNIVM